MNELLKNISCDHYQDDIVLMDEAQMADNRRLIVDSINSLIQHDFTVLILPSAGLMEIEVAGQQYECGRGQLLTAILSEGIVLKRMSDDFAAKKRLAHSNMSVEQIAAELNFANASHFGTYFKRTVGLSPATYRKTKRK